MEENKLIIYNRTTIVGRIVYIIFLAVVLVVFSVALYKTEKEKSYTIKYIGSKQDTSYTEIN